MKFHRKRHRKIALPGFRRLTRFALLLYFGQLVKSNETRICEDNPLNLPNMQLQCKDNGTISLNISTFIFIL